MSGMHRQSGTLIDNLDAHVRQSIGDIITTPIGSRVMRREYGSLIPELVDQPLTRTTILRLYAATAAAIMRWEPRFKISRISLELRSPAGAMIEVAGRIGTAPVTINTPVGDRS
ncbi:GPW/gp25 family protein [Marinobacterium stanieri]|uniref:IraD/Gp25-like domain-containing protein n=1 Tax=Marinobacterium stanieri TaxID=49186 RepID=A0A1N6Q327_9GAMM|nr:GPW/gp25 family protein [Marinobacterium stanieri]SIQ10879.1 hypothetical protein SAMN05421647_102213 [Marinobacterium stanieri]